MKAEKESKTFRNVVLTGCLGCLGIIVLVAIGVATLFFWSKDTIGTPAMTFVETLESRDYEAAYALTGGDWRHGSTPKEFEETYAKILDDLGPRISIKSAGFSFDGDFMSPSRGVATYSARYEDAGQVFVRVEMTRVDGEWRVIDTTYSSRIRQQHEVESCPHCGARVESPDSFCAQCGGRLDDGPEEQP